MLRLPLRLFRLLAAGIVLASIAAPTSADAQSLPQPDPGRAPRDRPAPDFLLGRPAGSLGVRGSWVFARAGSDVFDFVQDTLTVDKGAFNGPAVFIDASFAIGRHVDVVGGFQFNRVSIASEYRDLVDNNFEPITQRTGLREVDLTASFKLWLRPRGREVSRFAWVPRRVAPYVGAGGGAMWYEFRQSGDFVDVADMSVFSDFFKSSGWTPSAHVFGGTDIHVYRRLSVSLEGRYIWASARLGPDFVDFQPIDLAGFRMSAGINLLY